MGGVTQKIEGFFDLCHVRGLTASQGVMIPSANRRHLMRRDDVGEAVSAGRFHVWIASEVDAALELLTGLPAGVRDSAGIYPERSLHRAVAGRIVRYAEALKTIAAEEKKPEPMPL